jgi:hypothetical protein
LLVPSWIAQKNADRQWNGQGLVHNQQDGCHYLDGAEYGAQGARASGCAPTPIDIGGSCHVVLPRAERFLWGHHGLRPTVSHFEPMLVVRTAKVF